MSVRKPTVQDFRDALVRIGEPGGRQLAFLKAHYDAPMRSLNMRRLSKAAGYSTPRTMNLQYGNLAVRIASALRRPPPSTAVFLLVEFIPPRQASNAEWILVMRPEFARALKAEGWVN